MQHLAVKKAAGGKPAALQALPSQDERPVDDLVYDIEGDRSASCVLASVPLLPAWSVVRSGTVQGACLAKAHLLSLCKMRVCNRAMQCPRPHFF